MHISNCFRTLLFFWAIACMGQRVEVIPDIVVAEAAYRDANEACLKNDPNLQRDLFKGDPEQVRRRIHRAASLRDDAMVKKEVYLKAEIQRLQSLSTRLTQGEIGTIPTDAERKSLESQQAHTLAEQSRVEGELRDLPEGNEYASKRRDLDAERTHLINVQNTIAQRLQSLDSIDKAQQAILNDSSGASLAQKLDVIVKLWEQERDDASRQRATWAQLYAAMERAVNKKSPDQATPQKPSKKAPRSAAPAPGSPSARAGGASGTTDTWACRRVDQT
jgi:hypothetical protein